MLTAAEDLCASVIGELLKARKGIKITQKPLETVRELEVWRALGDMRTKERKRREKRPSYTIPVVAWQNFGFMNV